MKTVGVCWSTNLDMCCQIVLHQTTTDLCPGSFTRCRPSLPREALIVIAEGGTTNPVAQLTRPSPTANYFELACF